MSSTLIHITAFYTFVPLPEDQLPRLREELLAYGTARDMHGLTLLATEGVNGTVCGSKQAIDEWKVELTNRFGKIVFKNSTAERVVFRRWSVKIKPEIVGLKRTDIRPAGKHRHLTPEEWQEMLTKEDVVLLDARNDYEVAIGTFKNAVNPNIESFQEFPDFAKKSDLPKSKKVLMFCTGGIRCEKALLAMEEQGFEDVYQLEGGILAYLEKFPHKNFEGECFVFDQRTAVNQELKPSEIYCICPHCGQPGDTEITCERCNASKKVCALCVQKTHRRSCSKRCANELAVLVVSS